MSKKKEFKRMAENARLEAGKLMTSKQITSCNAIIHTAAVACGACGGIPIPIADAVPMSAAQVTMVLSLGKVFDIKLTNSAAKSILSGAAGILVGRAAVSGILKFIPVAGWIASAAVAAAVTEALGWSIANDFASQYRKNYEIQREKERAEEAVKAEKRKMEEEFANYMDDMDEPDEYDEVNYSEEDFVDISDNVEILITTTYAYVYKGKRHLSQIIPTFHGEKVHVSMIGAFNGLKLPQIEGYIGKCFEDNQATFIPLDFSVDTTLKSWCLNNINTIKPLFSKHNITDNEINMLASDNDLSHHDSILHLKWITLLEELLRSSDLKKTNEMQ